MSFRLVLSAVALACAGASATAAPQVSIFKLSNAVAAALEYNPSVRSARLGVDLAETHAHQAQAARFPSVRLSETIAQGNNPVFVFGSLLEQSRFGPDNFSLQALNNPKSITNVRTSISADFQLFDGMKTLARIEQSRIGRERAVIQQTRAEQQVRFEVIRDYFGVLLAEAQLQVAEEAIEMGEADVRRAADRLDAGLAVRSELLSAQVQLAEFRQQRIRAEGESASAMAALNISIGFPSGTQHTFATEIAAREFQTAALEQIVNEAVVHRADSRLSELGIELAERRVSEQRGALFPEVRVFGSVGTSRRSITNGSNDYSVGAALTYNLFEAGRRSKTDAAQLQKGLMQTERDRARDLIRIEVTRAYYSYRAAEGQLAVAEASLSQAEEALRIVQDRYEAGLTTIVDLLRAETAVVRSRMSVVASRYDQQVGYANLLLSAGTLDDVDAFER